MSIKGSFLLGITFVKQFLMEGFLTWVPQIAVIRAKGGLNIKLCFCKPWLQVTTLDKNKKKHLERRKS